MYCFPFIVTLSRERYSVLGFIACYSSRRKEKGDLMVNGKTFYLYEDNEEYGGHDVISFPHLYYTIICTTYVDQATIAMAWQVLSRSMLILTLGDLRGPTGGGCGVLTGVSIKSRFYTLLHVGDRHCVMSGLYCLSVLLN